MTDAPEGPAEGEPDRGSRRTPRVDGGGSPVGYTRGIVLAVIAVIAGFFILRAITDDDGDGGVLTDDASSTVPDEPARVDQHGTIGGTTTVPGPTTLAPSVQGATVSVANASGVSGSAAGMTQALAAAGYTMGEPGNNTGGADLTTSVVYFAPGDTAAQSVALSVAQALGGLTTEAMPKPPPMAGGQLEAGATVLLMVGTDRAGQTLGEQIATGAGTTTIPARPPTVAGATSTTARALIRPAQGAPRCSSASASSSAVARSMHHIGSRGAALLAVEVDQRATWRDPARSTSSSTTPAPPRAATGTPCSAASPCYPADDLALEALRIEVPLARDDEVDALEVVGQVELVRDQLEAGQERAAERGERPRQAAGRTGPLDRAHVDAPVVPVDLHQPLEPPGEHAHLRR